MIITRAWDCGCHGWDVRNKTSTRQAHAKKLVNAICLYLAMRFTDALEALCAREK